MKAPEKTLRICLFGGTFDPVHNGHVQMAEKVVSEGLADEIVFIPCRQSPLKETATGASGAQRVKMLELATRNLLFAKVDDLELERPLPSFSYQTVQTYQEDNPGAQIQWVLGTDQWNALDDWRESEFLLKTLEFIVLQRGEEPLVQRPSSRMKRLEFSHPASATAIRQSLSVGQEAKWLDEKVAKFIKAENLYS